MNKKLDEIKSFLGVTEYTFNEEPILDLCRYMRQQELFNLRAQILIDEKLCEVTFDDVLVIFGLMTEAKIGIYKNPDPEKYPVEFILIHWKDLSDTWASIFFKGLKWVKTENPIMERQITAC